MERTQEQDRFALRALYETSQLLSGSLDLDFVLNNLLLIAMSKLFITRGVVLLHDAVRDVFSVAVVKGVTAWNKHDVLEMDVIKGTDEIRDEAVPEVLAEQRIVLLLPIVYQDQCIGLLGLGRKVTGQPCEGPELEFVKSLVNISSAAVHNSLMVEELRQANRDLDAKIQELNTLFDLSREFNATRDRKRLVRLFSFALMGQLLVQRHCFLLRRPNEAGTTEQLEVVASQGIAGPTLSMAVIDRMGNLEEMISLEHDTVPEGCEPMKELGLHIVLPLRQGGITQGVLGLGPKMTGQSYQSGDVEFLYALGNLALTSIQNTYLVEDQIEKERLAEEMRLATEIQQRLLPQSIPECIGIDIAAYATPSREVGGDYFDLSLIPENKLMVAIADVTGKGVPAALLMANIQACLRALLPLDLTLEDATARINEVIHSNTGFDKFITFFWGLYHTDSNQFSYVNAGHDPPLHIKLDGSMTHLKDGGLLLGVLGQAFYQRGAIQLEAGDVVAMFTDGVTEAMNSDMEEYGQERLEAEMIRHRHGTAQDILDAVLGDVHAHTDGHPQSDDITMIVLKAV